MLCADVFNQLETRNVPKSALAVVAATFEGCRVWKLARGKFSISRIFERSMKRVMSGNAHNLSLGYAT